MTKITPTKLAAIIAPLAVLAIVIIPNFSIPVQPTNNQQNSPLNRQIGDVVQENIPKITTEQLETCSSLTESVRVLLGGDEVADSQEAADLIIGAFCNRPQLITEIPLSNYPALTLIAFGCETINGTIQDESMKDTLSGFSDLYCSGAKAGLREESQNLMVAVSEIESANENQTDTQPQVNATSFDMIMAKMDNSTSLIDSRPYQAAIQLDTASKIYMDSFGGGEDAIEEPDMSQPALSSNNTESE